MKITRAHNMDKPQAKAWLDQKSAEMLNKFGASISDHASQWNGDNLEFAFTAAGVMRFRGSVAVTPDAYRINLPFPLLAKPYEARAKTEINQWLDDNLPKPK